MIRDAHIHVGKLTRANFPYYYTPADIAFALRENGVSEFIFSSMSALMAEDGAVYDKLEEESRTLVSEFGSGAHPFYWITGDFFDQDRRLSVLDKGFWEGLKIHELDTPWVKSRADDLDRILSIAEERGLPVQFHTGEDGGCYPHEILPFVKRHPKLRVDFAHCRPWEETIDCLKECENLFTDTAFMLPEHYSGLISAGVEDRVMFGTDLPLQCALLEDCPSEMKEALKEIYAGELAKVGAAEYSDRVMYRNFQRFLRGDA